MKPHPPGAVSSLVFGILSMVSGVVPVLGAFLGLVAIAASRRAHASLVAAPEAYEPGGLHTAGLVTGTIGLLLSLLATLWMLMMVGLIGAVVAAVSGHPLPPPPAEAPLLW